MPVSYAPDANTLNVLTPSLTAFSICLQRAALIAGRAPPLDGPFCRLRVSHQVEEFSHLQGCILQASAEYIEVWDRRCDFSPHLSMYVPLHVTSELS